MTFKIVITHRVDDNFINRVTSIADLTRDTLQRTEDGIIRAMSSFHVGRQ